MYLPCIKGSAIGMILMQFYMHFRRNAFEKFIEFTCVYFTGANTRDKVFIPALGMGLEKRVAFRTYIGWATDIYRQRVTIIIAVISAFPRFTFCDRRHQLFHDHFSFLKLNGHFSSNRPAVLTGFSLLM